MNIRKRLIALALSFCAIVSLSCLSAMSPLLAGGQHQDKRGYTPKTGFVPDERTALAVAKAVLTPAYGEKQLQTEEPFTASLDGDTWFVFGHLPEGYLGGVAEVKISKSKGCILSMYHGK